MHTFYVLFFMLQVLFWLPHKLPEGTIFIVSANSLQSEIEDELVSIRSFNKLEIEDLSEEMRQDFAVVSSLNFR